jgi:hypothetical protein
MNFVHTSGNVEEATRDRKIFLINKNYVRKKFILNREQLKRNRKIKKNKVRI